MGNSNTLLTRHQAADFLSCSVRKIDTLVSAGKLRATAIGDRGTRIARDDLQAFLQGSKLVDAGAVYATAERAIGRVPDSHQLSRLAGAAGVAMRAGDKLAAPDLDDLRRWLRDPNNGTTIAQIMRGGDDVSSKNYGSKL